MKKPGARYRQGLSLLEVMLAIAILGVAMAMIGELIRIGYRSALNARHISHAQILCDTKMAEISSGALPLESVAGASLEEAPGWTYSIQIQNSSQIGLLEVRVTVDQESAAESAVARSSFTLTRFVPDPDYDPYEPAE